jgi:hypothetical protein
MSSSCAACRRASDVGSARAICASCGWTVARTHRQTAQAGESPSSSLTRATHEEYAGDTTDELLLLFGLAPLVGEHGSAVVERVLRQMRKGNTRAYRLEINRLTDKFIASLEAPPPTR